MREHLTLKHLTIIHPVCGGTVVVTDIDSTDSELLVEAICPDCDKYVYLVYRTRCMSTERPKYSRVPVADVEQALIKSGGNMSRAAKSLGINRQTINRMARRGYIHGANCRKS